MRERIGMIVFLTIFSMAGCTQQSLADDLGFTFRSKDDAHSEDYEYGASINCLFDDTGNGEYKVLMQAYGSRGMATEDAYPKMFVYLEELQSQVPSNPACLEEWHVLNGTYKGFIYASLSFDWTLFMPAILAAGNKGYTFRTTTEHHPREYAYAVSITYLSGKYRVLLRGYGDKSVPKDSEYQDLFIYLEGLQSALPSVETTGNEVDWYVSPGTFKGFYSP